MRNILPIVLLAAILPAADGAVLTFSGLGLSDRSPIPQDYGDQSNLNVIYGTRNLSGGVVGDLLFWATGYLNTTDVAYSSFDGNFIGEVALIPAPGNQVTLNNFTLAPWISSRSTQFTVFNGDFSSILASSGGEFTLATGFNMLVSPLTSTNGIRIQFGPDAFNVGIDNIDFDVAPIPVSSEVPEPSTAALLVSGLGGAALLLRRRKL